MGHYTFRWPYPGTEVYVTGTFDNWAQSVKLDLTDNGFSKKVELPDNEKIHYKVCDSLRFSAFRRFCIFPFLRFVALPNDISSPTFCVRRHGTFTSKIVPPAKGVLVVRRLGALPLRNRSHRAQRHTPSANGRVGLEVASEGVVW